VEDGYGVIRINDLGSEETVAEFDQALAQLRKTRGLILDLRGTQSGGSTSVAEPILGRFIAKRAAYQRGKPRNGKPWTREVSPRGPWRYPAPMVALVSRWTGSMGEGMAIGLDGMKRATVVGTPMAGLVGAVFTSQLKHSGIRFNYAAEKLFHIDGTPREAFVPKVVVEESNSNDAGMLSEALRVLKAMSR
jgi:carboxyl-terminal processing protease